MLPLFAVAAAASSAAVESFGAGATLGVAGTSGASARTTDAVTALLANTKAAAPNHVLIVCFITLFSLIVNTYNLHTQKIHCKDTA